MTDTVEIRMIDGYAEIARVVKVLDRVWGTEPGKSMLDVSTLIALRGGGHYIAGAYVGEELIGGCIGFFVEPLGQALHSHIAGVLPGRAQRGVGRMLKTHQRDWCLERGISEIQWTFDPLVARNAHFNLRTLGAMPLEYKPNYYGALSDSINQGEESDRLLVRWLLRDPDPARELAYEAEPDPAPLLTAAADGRPVVDTAACDSASVSVEIPADIERMRLEDPVAARAWRTALRAALHPIVGNETWQCQGFDADHRFIFRKAL